MATTLGSRGEEDIIAEINVTPLVDIVLVLLIIFMVTASFIVAPAIRVDLPRAANGEDNPSSALGFILTREGKLFVNGNAVKWEELPSLVQEKRAAGGELQAVISADREVSHGLVIRLIDAVKGLGIVHFALNIEQSEYVAPEKAKRG
jgi:biopolymer transport protein TolR